MDTIEIGQIWVGNVDGTRFEIVASNPTICPCGTHRPSWKWRMESGQTGTASEAVITHGCTLATD